MRGIQLLSEKSSVSAGIVVVLHLHVSLMALF